MRGSDLGNAERHQIIERITGFIDRHGDSRFSDADCDDTQRAAMVRDRAGWWRLVAGERIYLFNADGMREALKGFDFQRALDALQQAGVIDKPGADGKRAKFNRIQGHGVKLYAVQPPRQAGAAA